MAKYRNDFVTNSSSSSFILVFDNEKDVENFKEICEWDGYEEFLELIKRLYSDTLTISNTSDSTITKSDVLSGLRKVQADVNLIELILDAPPFEINPNDIFEIEFNKFGEMETSVSLDEIEIPEFEIYFLSHKENRNKDTMIEHLRWCYICDFRQEYIKENVPKKPGESWNECIERKNLAIESEDYKNKVEEFLKNTDYHEKVERIANASTVLSSTIWDTSGGMVEWAIRNGFIEDNFREFCLLVWNVG